MTLIDDEWRTKTLIGFDTETTGLCPLYDRVVEVGYMVFQDWKFIEERSWLVYPDCKISTEVSAIHGITDADVKEAPVMRTVIREGLLDLPARFPDFIPVAYNARFDKAMLQAEWIRSGERPVRFLGHGSAWLDPLVWARSKFKYQKGGKKLRRVCELLGIPFEEKHRTLNDVAAAMKVLRALAADLPRNFHRAIDKQDRMASFQETDRLTWKMKMEDEAAERALMADLHEAKREQGAD